MRNYINETNGFITEYSMTTASEDMAEVFSFLMKDKIKLYEKSIKDPILKKWQSIIQQLSALWSVKVQRAAVFGAGEWIIKKY